MAFRLLSLLLITIPLSGFSQIAVSGKVLNAVSNSAISFANIGIVNSDVGTISEEDGTFSISITENYLKARLLFSALGFKRISISIDSVRNFQNIVVTLIEEPLHLKPVTVTGDGFKRKFVFGNEASEGGTVYADTVT